MKGRAWRKEVKIKMYRNWSWGVLKPEKFLLESLKIFYEAEGEVICSEERQ